MQPEFKWRNPVTAARFRGTVSVSRATRYDVWAKANGTVFIVDKNGYGFGYSKKEMALFASPGRGWAVKIQRLLNDPSVRVPMQPRFDVGAWSHSRFTFLGYLKHVHECDVYYEKSSFGDCLIIQPIRGVWDAMYLPDAAQARDGKWADAFELYKKYGRDPSVSPNAT